MALVLKLRRCHVNDPPQLRSLQLRLLSAVIMGKQLAQKHENIGATYKTVNLCSPRVLADLRPFARGVLRAVSGLLKGGEPDPKGVLMLATENEAPPTDVVVKCIQKAVLLALVEKRVRKLGKEAWVTQLLSMFVGELSKRDILAMFSDLGRDEGHVFEITRHHINVAMKRAHRPGAPVPVTKDRRQCLAQNRIEQLERFIALHRRQVAPTVAASTVRLDPIVWVLTSNYKELYSLYVVC